MFDIKKIVVPTDFSKISYSAFEYARDLAERMNSEVHIINVMENSPPLLPSKNHGLSEKEIFSELETEARKQLSEAASFFMEDSSIIVREVLLTGNDYEEIVNYAKAIDSDIIIIATRGRTGILHTLLGSVAEKVIRFAKCPVLVISPKDDE
jgi:nucleotide-binding universal stress UspA family protein